MRASAPYDPSSYLKRIALNNCIHNENLSRMMVVAGFLRCHLRLDALTASEPDISHSYDSVMCTIIFMKNIGVSQEAASQKHSL